MFSSSKICQYATVNNRMVVLSTAFEIFPACHDTLLSEITDRSLFCRRLSMHLSLFVLHVWYQKHAKPIAAFSATYDGPDVSVTGIAPQRRSTGVDSFLVCLQW